jgi:hypothetical protein
MGRWRGFLDSLATTGGHIFVLIYFIQFGVVASIASEIFHWAVVAKLAENMTSAMLGALLMMYKSSGTNSEQLARAGVPYQPAQPPPDALKPPIIVSAEPLPPSTENTEGKP